MSRPAASSARRSLLALFARRSGLRSSRHALLVSVGTSLGQTVAVALLAAPFAIAWGVGHAEITDYLGPHQVSFASNYRGEVDIDLGPIGNAYLPSPRAPIGAKITVGGVGALEGNQTSFFSEQTLAEYAGVFAEPEEAVRGVVERLTDDMVVESLKAELVLLGAFGVWVMRHELLAPWLHRRVSVRRAAAAYVTSFTVLFGSLAAPPPPSEGLRLPVSANLGTSFQGLTVDSLLIADLIDRGVDGITLLTQRQRKAVNTYISTAGEQLANQAFSLPRAVPGETLLLGFSDLHCNQAMTELIRRLVLLTGPAVVLSSGDDTVNGTAAERFCVTREAKIAGEVPFVVSSGNHDSNVTESQQRSAGIKVLDGTVDEAADIAVLGDDDPEHNIPFSVERVSDRPETEEQLGERLGKTAEGKEVDVILVHQPAASVVLMTTPNPPARLVLWGHFHSQAGPTVVTHDDGSWTVGMQEGTAGGVRQPTITEFSTPFSPPLISADVYFYFRDDATGLITGVQPVHFLPGAKVVIERRIKTGDLARLPLETRQRLAGGTDSVSPTPTPTPGSSLLATPANSR
jgi:predicted phosphodiesterase